MMLREFWGQMPASLRLSLVAKSLVFSLVGVIHSRLTRSPVAVMP